jgi:hypothetical protein
MTLGWDPSHDADRYFNQQEESAVEEAAFYKEHRALIVQVVSAMLSNPAMDPMRMEHKEHESVVEYATEIVRQIVYRGDYE